MLYICVRGQSATAETYFKNSDGLPLAPGASSATYEVRDFSNNLIVSGNGAQDSDDSSHWTATFNIPLTAPVSEGGDKYSITWRLKESTNKEYFLLVAEGEPPPKDVSVAMMENTFFKDTICLPMMPTNLTIEIRDIKGERIYPECQPQTNIHTSIENVLFPAADVDTSNPRYIGSNYYFDFYEPHLIPDLVAGSYGANPYIIIWNYDLPTSLGNIEIHPLYVLNTKAFKYINDLKMSLDKARVEEFDKSLGFSTTDLAHYVLSGIQRINVSEPQLTFFNLNTMPDEFSYLVNKSALCEAYHSAYLAEALKSFEFTGQSTTLNVDRTQYYQVLMDGVNSYLENAIKGAKRIYFRSGAGSRFGLGTLSISMTPNTTIPYSLPSNFLSNFRWR